MNFGLIELAKIQDELLDELAQNKGGPLKHFDTNASMYSKKAKSGFGGGGLSQSVNNRFQMGRPGASTLYKVDNNTVDIDDNDFFDGDNAGNDIPNYDIRASALTTNQGGISTEGNDLLGPAGRQRKRRPVSSLRTLQT